MQPEVTALVNPEQLHGREGQAQQLLSRERRCWQPTWNCTMGCRLLIASCTSLLQRLMTSALAPARWMAPASTAPATTALLSTTACSTAGRSGRAMLEVWHPGSKASVPNMVAEPCDLIAVWAGVLPAAARYWAMARQLRAGPHLLEVALDLQQHLRVDDAAQHADGVRAVQVVAAVHVLHQRAAEPGWGGVGVGGGALGWVGPLTAAQHPPSSTLQPCAPR